MEKKPQGLTREGGDSKKKRGENKEEEEEELRWWVRRYLCGRAEKPSPEEAADYDGDCGGAVMGWDGMGCPGRTSSVSKMAVRPERKSTHKTKNTVTMGSTSAQLN